MGMVLFYLISSIISFIVLAFWVLMIMDCIRRGEYFWLWILIFFVPLGAVIYYLVYHPPIVLPSLNLLPGTQSSRSNDRIKEIKAKINRAPDAFLYQELGRLLLEDGKPGEALQALDRSLEMEPEKISVHFLKGKALVLTGSFREAVPHLEKALDSKDRGQVSSAMKLLAENYESSGEDNKAIECYDRLIKCYPFSQARYRYGALLERHGRLPEAVSQMKSLLEETQDLPAFSMKQEREWIRKAEEFLRRHDQL
ncbi:MAG: tetratricopeptide repeat protein [Vulcanimicrobiota bacterium]